MGFTTLFWDGGNIKEFIEVFEVCELTDELNNFIDRLNRVQAAEVDKFLEAELDSVLYLDPNYTGDEVDLQVKRKILRSFTLNLHFQSTNVFWVGELTEKRYLLAWR